MTQLKLFEDKDVFIIKRPDFCTLEQKNQMIKDWSDDAWDLGFTCWSYEDDDGREKLEKIFWPLFDNMSEFAIKCHLEEHFDDAPKEFDDDDAKERDEKSEEYEDFEIFVSDVCLQISYTKRKNIEQWVKVHDLKLTLNPGDCVGDKIIKTRVDIYYFYIYNLLNKLGDMYLNGENILLEIKQ